MRQKLFRDNYCFLKYIDNFACDFNANILKKSVFFFFQIFKFESGRQGFDFARLLAQSLIHFTKILNISNFQRNSIKSYCAPTCLWLCLWCEKVFPYNLKFRPNIFF